MSTKLTASSLTAISGTTLSIPITVLDDNDVAVDMTGATIAFVIARSVGATAAVSIAAGTASSSIASNVVTISVTAANTEALQGSYYFECKATDTSSNVAVIAYGTITFGANQ